MRRAAAPIKQQSGFTLIEIAIAFAIIALMVGSLAGPLAQRIEYQKQVDSQINITKSIEALMAFAVMNKRLPCPDVNTNQSGNKLDGKEDRVSDSSVGLPASTYYHLCGDNASSSTIAGFGYSGNGTRWVQSTTDAKWDSPGSNPSITPVTYSGNTKGASYGFLPYQDLGLSLAEASDAWGNKLAYLVFTPLTSQALPAVPNGIYTLQNANLKVICHLRAATVVTGCPSSATEDGIVAENIAFAVYSLGSNAFGATSGLKTGGTPDAVPFVFPDASKGSSTDERLNQLSTQSSVFDATRLAAANPTATLVQRIRTPFTDTATSPGEFDDIVTFISVPAMAARLMAAGVWP